MRRTWTLGLLVVAVSTVAFAAGLAGSGAGVHLATPQFLSSALGQPQANAPLSRQPAAGVTARVNRNGYTVQRNGSALTLSSVDAAGSAWQRTANGAMRSTPFGSEAIVIDAARTEQYLVVTKHQGLQTWRWRLRSGDSVPHLGADGTVTFTKNGKAVGYRIAPVSITDSAHTPITPAGLRWSLAHEGGKTFLVLRLNDSNLPTPYVIDPATDYASPLYETTTQSTVLGGGTAAGGTLTYKLVTSAPSSLCTASTTATDTCPAIKDTTNNAGTTWDTFSNYNAAAPVASSFGSLATPPTGQTANGDFLVDGASTSVQTTIPTGTWTFDTWTKAFAAPVANVAIDLSVGVYLVTTNGTGATATIQSVDSTVIDPSTNASADLTQTTTETKRTISVSGVPAVTLGANQHILVVFWAKKIVVSGSLHYNSLVALEVNGTSVAVPTQSQFSLPAATDTACITCTWTGSGGNNNWSTGANWSGGLPPATNGTATLTFPNGPSVLTTNNDETNGTTFAGINISGSGYTLAGNSIALGSGGIADSTASGSNTISLAMSMANAATPIGVTNAAETLTLSGVISGAGGPTKSGSGVLVPSNTNTYTGATTISGGTLQANATGAIGNGSATNTLTFSGGTLQATGTVTSPSTRTVSMSGAGTIDTNGNAVSIAGVISGGGGALTKSGSGALTLSGANTFSQGLSLSSGQLNVNNATALGTGTLTISGGTTIDNTTGASITESNNNAQAWNGDFTFTGTQALNLGTGAVTLSATRQVTVSASTLTVGGVIGGSFGLTKAGAGTLAITGTNTYSGNTTISAGTLQADATTALGNASNQLIFNGGTLQAIGAITSPNTRTVSLSSPGTIDTNGFAVSIAGVISGSNGLTKNGTNTLTLSGVNTYSGSTTISAGTLNANASAAIGDGSATNTLVFSGGTLQAGGTITSPSTRTVTLSSAGTIDTNNNSVSIAGVISGANSLTKNGTGSLTLSATNTFTGGTTLNAGTLNINNAQALGTVAGTFTIAGGTIDNTSAAAITTLNYPQSWTGDFAFTGTKNLNLGTGAVTMSASRTITGNGGTLTVGGVISGNTFSLSKAGNGALALGGANTFTGGVNLNAGELDINNATALGTGTFTLATGAIIDNTSGSAITETNNNAQTWNGTYTFNGSNNLNLGTGAVDMSGGNANWTVTAGTLTENGIISGGKNLHLLAGSGGSLALGGANTFTGGIQVIGGTLDINNATALGTGALQFNGGSIDNTSGLPITETNNNTITLMGSFGITFTGSNDLNLGTGAVNLGPNVRTVSVGGSNLTLGGVISGGGGIGLTKTGAGTLTLSNAANTYNGTTTVSAGTLSVTGSIASSAVSLNGGTLRGTGTTGAVTSTASGGTVWPGNSPGTLSTGAVDIHLGSTTYFAELNGTTAGTNYGVLNVTGTVNLTGATLSGSVGYTPAQGDSYTIINNDGVDAITGTFSGAPQGSTVTIGGRHFTISYVGGSGNDVTLTASDATDGTGTASISPTSAVAGTTNNTETLTYTAATGGMSSGAAVTLAVPANWTAPQISSGSSAGFTQVAFNGGAFSTTGVSVVGQTITYTLSSTLNAGQTIAIRYGDTSVSSAGAAADPSNAQSGSATWTVQMKATGGTLTSIASSPSVNVTNAADGSGTASIAPTSQVAGSTGLTETLTYTETVAGGTNAGAVELTVPANWSAPSTTNGAGCTTSSSGSVGVAGQVITVTGVTLAQSATLTITYGATTGACSSSTGAVGPTNAQSGSATWSVREKSTSGGTLTGIGSSPSVNVTNAADGTGTLTTPTTSVTAGSTGNTIAFTYTPVAGGLNTGEVDVAVPSGWTTPVTTNAIGCTTASGGSGSNTISFSGNTIKVSGVTLTSAQTLAITYGATSGGSCTASDGATASTVAGSATWQGQEKSTSGGTLANIASPSITVNPAALDHFSVTNTSGGNIGTQTAGSAFNIEVQAFDQFGNLDSSGPNNYTGTVDVTSNKTCSAGCNQSAGFVNGVLASKSVTLTQAANGTATITATDHGGTKTGTSNAFTVNPGTADATQSTLTPTSSSITANGTATQTLTVQAKDAFGNNLTSGGSTVSITKQSGTGTIGSVTDNTNGTYTATVTAPTATGSGVFVATLGGNPVQSGTGSQTQATVNYVPGTATHLSFGQAPTNTVAGVTMTPAVTVRVLDATNNVVTTDSSTKVTLAIGTNPSGGTLSGGGQTTVSSGVATFSGLSIDKFGNGYTLAASDTTGGGGIHPLTSDTSSTFNITARTSSTSVSCATNPVTYGGSTLCTATVSDSQGAGTSSTPGGTVAFASNGSGTFTSSGNCTLSSGSCAVTYTPTAVGTGTHQVSATYTSNDSIHGGSSSSGAGNFNVTVNKATLTVTPDPQSRSYGQAAPSYTFSVTGFQFSDNAGNASGYVAPSCTSDYTTATTVANSPRTITCSGGSADNYSFNTSATANLTVTKATLTVTPDPQSRTYGDAAPSYTFSVTGFQNGQNAGTASGYVAPSCTSDYTTATTVAQSPRTISCSGGSADNYSFDTSATANLTVSKATLTVTPDPKSRTYGQAAPSYTFSVTGFQNGQNAGTASGYAAPSCTSDYTTTTNVAQSPRTISCSGGSADNYSFDNSATANLTVSKATLTVTPDPQSRTYGDAAPSYTFSVTGFQNGQNAGTASGYVAPSCTSDYTTTTAVAQSPRTISCSGGSADNYSFDTSATANLSITTRPLTVTANNRSKVYGTTLSLGTSAFTTNGNEANSEVVTSVTLTSTSGNDASTTAPVGTYSGDIVPSAATGSNGFLAANYNITYANGDLSITPATFTKTSDVQINGTPTVGVASTITNAVFSPTVTSRSHQWQLCNASGNSCSDIFGATDKTYTPVGGDAGHTLRVVQTVSRANYNDGSSTSDPSPVVVNGHFSTTTAVAINGSPKVGVASTLTAGSYTPSPSGSSYQWRQCDSSGNNCSDISGATNSTYTPVAADVGNRLRVVETVTATGYNNGSSTSAASAVVIKGDFSLNTAVAVNGTPTVGTPTTLTAGSYTPSPTGRTYQWQLCNPGCADISGATGSTYTPVAGDVGWTLQVIETVTQAGYNDGGSTSAASPAVINGSFSSNTAVAINGTPKAGVASTLTPGSYTPSPATRAYQWRLCNSSGASCADIGSATNSTYTPVPGDVGHTLRVVEMVTQSGYNNGSFTSAASPVVVNGDFSTTTAVAINGTPKVATASTLTMGSYTPSPSGRTYQWQRCDNTGANCTNISSATSSTYTPVGADAGNRLRVVETVTTAGYNNGSSTSNASPVVQKADFVTNTPVSISGTPTVGTVSSRTAGSYTPTPANRTYQWQRCDSTGANCSNISGATSTGYTPVAADAGNRLRVVETVTATGYNNGGSTSAASPVVAKGTFVVDTAVTIFGNPQRGVVSHVTQGSYSPTPTSRTYQWLRCSSTTVASCVAISGATASSYTPVTADAGNRLRVIETVSKAGYNDKAVTSVATAIVP